MANAGAKSVRITVVGHATVSGLLQSPRGATALLVLAHGAGAGMTHPFFAAIADGLARRGIGTLRYQFPYMELGAKRPDRPEVAHAAVRAAVAAAKRLRPKLPLFAGGKSFGGRMTSQAQAAAPLAAVRGLVYLGFPLHPANKPGTERAQHLGAIAVPQLFLQGTRDPLADLKRLKAVCRRLGPAATLHVVDGADHSFHVPARSGRTDEQVRNELLDTVAGWLAALAGPHRRRET